MFFRVEKEEIEEKWYSLFESAVHLALNASTGAHQTIGYHKDAIKNIYNKLTNPFNTSMQLWVAETDDVNYVMLTQIQVCEFTGRRSLLWFSWTRIREIDTVAMIQAYEEGEQALKQFAKDNNCEGISGYTDLEYLKNKVQEDWPDASTRYFFYLPIK